MLISWQISIVKGHCYAPTKKIFGWGTEKRYTLKRCVIRALSKSKKAFSTVAALIRMHLISHLDLTWIVTEGRRAYTKRRTSRNKSPATVQMSLF